MLYCNSTKQSCTITKDNALYLEIESLVGQVIEKEVMFLGDWLPEKTEYPSEKDDMPMDTIFWIGLPANHGATAMSE